MGFWDTITSVVAGTDPEAQEAEIAKMEAALETSN